MPNEPPGPKYLREFIESLSSLNGVDARVAQILRDLYEKSALRSPDIVAALRAARDYPTRS